VKTKNGPRDVAASRRPRTSKQSKTTTIEDVLQLLSGVRRTGKGQWEAKCPCHDDQRASLSIGLGDEGRILLNCHAGCTVEDVVRALGLKLSDLMPHVTTPQRLRTASSVKVRRKVTPEPSTNGHRKIVATYDYTDADGELLYQVVRYAPKDFRQRRPNGSGGWLNQVGDVRRVLYRLPELRDADPKKSVFVVEGEKDVETLRAAGFAATCNVGGAGKWRPEYSEELKGRKVVILPDNDDPGRRHGEQIAQSLQGIARSVRILELPGLPEKGDASDWFAAGGTRAKLLALVKECPPWTLAESRADEFDACTLNDVEARKVRWLWNERVACGMFHDWSGDPGGGKSLVLMDFLARLTQGWPMAPGPRSKIGSRKPVNVLLLTGEEALAETLRPRMEAAGADLKRVKVIQSFRDNGTDVPISLPEHCPQLEAFIERHRIGCVGIDPLMSFMSRDLDSHADADARVALTALAKVAERTGAAIVGIRHLNKKSGGSPIYRSGGSIAFAAVARVVMMIGRDPEDDDVRVFAAVKSNVGREPESLAYRIGTKQTSVGEMPIVEWIGPTELRADKVIDLPRRKHGPEPLLTDKAVEVLRELLADGPMKSKELEAAAAEQGISRGTYDLARKKLGVAGAKEPGVPPPSPWWTKEPGQVWPWEKSKKQKTT